MGLIIENIKKSWNLFYNNLKSLPIFVLIDIIFFFGFALVYMFMWQTVQSTMFSLNSMMSTMNLDMASVVEMQDSGAFVNFQQNFNYHFRKLALYFILSVILLYLVWMLTQGISWFIASRISQKRKLKTGIVKYVLNFALVSAIWGVIATVFIRLGVYFANKSLYTVVPSVGMGLSTYITGFFMVIILYFLFTSYALIQFYQGKELVKKSFTEPIRQAKIMVPAFLVSVIIAIICNYAIMKLVPVGFAATFSFFIIIMLPAFAFVRIYLVKSVSK